METSILIATPIILGLAQCIKIAGVKSKFIPLTALGLGVLLSFMMPELDVLGGMIAGLTASGLYSGVKKTVS